MLHTRRVTDNDGDVSWVVFTQGHFSTPVAVMTDLEMKRLVRGVEEQSAAVALHQSVILTDEGQCTFDPKGTLCECKFGYGKMSRNCAYHREP